MLEFMRKNAGSKIVWFIIGAISLVFVFFGVGGSQGGGRLIKVNGEEISLREYENMTRAMARNMPNDPNADPVLRDRQLRGAVVETLVSRALVSQFSRELGLVPTDRAMARYIYGIEAFQVDGQFNKEQYERQLGGMRPGGMTPAEFEKDARRDLAVSQASALVGSLSQVYPPEARDIYHFRSDKMRFDYIFFPSEKYKADLKPTDEALAAFYAANGEKWRLPATLKLEYVEIKPADFLDKVEIGEAELQDAFQENKERFTRPETARVRHIFFKFPRMNPTPEEKAAVLLKAEETRKDATPENFAEKAGELSEDPMSAAKGGDLGDISSETPLFNITDKVLALPQGAVSEPVESLAGYHLFMVDGRQEARPRTLDEVRDELAQELKTYKAREMAVAQLEELILRSETSKLSEAAQSLNLAAQTSEAFTQDNPPSFFEGNAEAVQRAFQAEVGRVASPVEESETLALYVPLERVESRVPPLEDVKAEVETAWRDDEAGQMARREAAEFIAAAGKADWDGAAAQYEGAKKGQSELLPRLDLMASIPLLFLDRMQLFAAINSVAAPGQISPVPVLGALDGTEGAYALKLAAFEPAPETGFEGMEGANIMVTESMNRAGLMSRVWMDELVKAANDKIYVPEEFQAR